MATAEGVFPKIGNDPIYASEANFFFSSVGSVVTDAVAGSFAVGGSAVEVVGPMTPGVKAQYARIAYYGTVVVNGIFNGTDDGGNANLKISTAESGTTPSYNVDFDREIGGFTYTGGNLGANTDWVSKTTPHIERVHTLTAGEKTSGLMVEFVVSSQQVQSGTAIVEFI